MNILLSCAGRRGYMVEYFRQALVKAGLKGKIYATNSHNISSAMALADVGFVSDSIYSKNYIDDLLNLAVQKNVGLIVPLLDLELPILAKAKKRFEKAGITVAVSNEIVCNISNDKWLTYSFLKQNGFQTTNCFLGLEPAMKAINNKSICFPLFVKPRWGMGSIALHVAENIEELRFVYNKALKEINDSYLKEDSIRFGEQSVIIQEKLPGDEYGLDIINDFKSNYVATFVKKKIGMRAGETDAATTINEPKLVEFGKQLSQKLKHIGLLDCDVFFDGQKPYLLEMNPRFGGGYPFSHIAGADIPLFYISQTQKQTNIKHIEMLSIKYNVTGVKNIHPIEIISNKIN